MRQIEFSLNEPALLQGVFREILEKESLYIFCVHPEGRASFGVSPHGGTGKFLVISMGECRLLTKEELLGMLDGLRSAHVNVILDEPDAKDTESKKEKTAACMR